MEREEREREYQFRREFELKKLEAETAIRMLELELRSAQFPAAVAGTVSSGSNTTGNFVTGINKTYFSGPCFL